MFISFRSLIVAVGAACVVAAAPARAVEPTIDMSLVQKNLGEKWLVSKTAVRETKYGRYESKVFERFAYPDEFLSVYMGNVVFYRIPKHKGHAEAESPDQTVENYRKAFGISHWNVRRQGPAHVYEALWLETMRYIKIFVAETPDEVRVSVSNFRLAYAESAYAETELIQRKLAGEDAIKAWPSVDRLFSYLGAIFPAAHADPAGGCNCAPYDQTCKLGCYSQSLGQLGPAINNAAGGLNNVANAGNNLNGTLGNVNQTGQQINGTAQQINGTAQQGIAAAQQQGNQLNATANRGVDEWHRTNDIAQQGVDAARRLTDPVVMGEVAFSASLMAGLGGAAASIMIEGFSAAASAVWEAFTHAQRDKNLVAGFKSAVEYYGKYKSQAGEIEKELDRMMYFFDLTKGLRKNREQLLDLPTVLKNKRSTEDELEALKKKKAELVAKSDACVRELEAGQTDLKELKDSFDALPPVAKGAEKARVMKECYGAIDKLISGLKARRAALPDSQLGCAEVITREISEYQGMKKEIGANPAAKTCDYQIESELAALEARKVAIPKNTAACVTAKNEDISKVQSQLDMLGNLEKFQGDMPSEVEFCKTMRQRLNGLKKLEYNLMQARSAIIAGLEPALRDKAKQDEQIDQNFKLGVQFADDLTQDEKKAAYKAALRDDKDYLPKREAYMKECVDALSPRLFGISWMPKVTDVPLAGGTYLFGDELFSKKGNSVIDRCVKAWNDGDYHKQFIANAKKRYNEAKETAAITRQAQDYLKANQDLIRGDRADMLGLYKDVVMEQVCVNGAPIQPDVDAAKQNCLKLVEDMDLEKCRKAGKNPRSFKCPVDVKVAIDDKHDANCEMLTKDRVTACNNVWYHREHQLVSFLNSTDEDISAACGL